MGLKKRNKFDRIYSASEDESTDDESRHESPKETQNKPQKGSLSESQKTDGEFENNGKPENSEKNNNNSNSTETEVSNIDTGKIYLNDKFLVTRSKRKYDKPQINIQKESICGQPESKRKRETIKSLDSKIKIANDFLVKLNKKLDDRDSEIRSLKEAISKERATNKEELPPKRTKATELDQLLNKQQNQNGQSDKVQGINFHDFTIFTGDEELDYIDDEEGMDQREDNRKRRRSRSRSKGRDETSRKCRKRSTSGNRISTKGETEEDKEKLCREDPYVQQLVKKMVEEQVKNEMDKRSKLSKHIWYGTK